MKEEPKSFEEAFDQIVGEAKGIMLSKRAQRGTSNILSQGEKGVFDRLFYDKMFRIKSHVNKNAALHLLRESGVDVDKLVETGLLGDLSGSGAVDTVEDDVMDVINYSIILMTLMKGWWKLP